jgi:general secretion pathway protein A
MYTEFYGFYEKPFNVTSDPRFLYLTSDHREALSAVLYGIQERRGLIALMGEVGTGKTTLLNAAMEELDQAVKVAYVFNTDVPFDDLLHMALEKLGIVSPVISISRTEALKRLTNFAAFQLSHGGNVVIIIDETQNLGNEVLEGLRLLSNIEQQHQKLVQIVLSGQPELDETLRDHRLRQLSQRISLKRYICPLNETQTDEYIRHRLRLVGGGREIFDERAMKLIWEFSGGIPRKINILCDNAFLIGYALERRQIGADILQEAIDDLTASPFIRPSSQQTGPTPDGADNHKNSDTSSSFLKRTLSRLFGSNGDSPKAKPKSETTGDLPELPDRNDTPSNPFAEKQLKPESLKGL